MSVTRPSRRHLVQAAAWTAPAVVVAAAAPTFASSTGGGTFAVSDGSSGVVLYQGKGLLSFNGFTTVPSAEIAAGGLTITVALVEGNMFSSAPDFDSWSSSDGTAMGEETPALLLTYSLDVNQGEVLMLDGLVGHDLGSGSPFTVTVAAPSFTSVTRTFSL